MIPGSWVYEPLCSSFGPSTIVGLSHLPLGIGLCFLDRSRPLDYFSAAFLDGSARRSTAVIAHQFLAFHPRASKLGDFDRQGPASSFRCITKCCFQSTRDKLSRRRQPRQNCFPCSTVVGSAEFFAYPSANLCHLLDIYPCGRAQAMQAMEEVFCRNVP